MATFSASKKMYSTLWNQMKVTKIKEATAQAKRIIKYKDRYLKVQELTNVPWFVVGCLHMRESNGNFYTWLHNGDPMKKNGKPVKTTHVPVSRPPDPNVSWEEGAKDALVDVQHFDKITDWSVERVAYIMESFNGFGYRSKGIPSPYLWGGTSVQKAGKYVADGKYDPSVMDTQIGGMAVLKVLMGLDPSAAFIKDEVEPKVEPKKEDDKQPTVDPSPKADDGTDGDAPLPPVKDDDKDKTVTKKDDKVSKTDVIKNTVKSVSMWSRVKNTVKAALGIGGGSAGYTWWDWVKDNPIETAIIVLILVMAVWGVIKLIEKYLINKS